MADIRLERLASLILDYSLGGINKGELVHIEATTVAEPMVRELIKGILNRGAHVYPQIRLTDELNLLFKYGNAEQVAYIQPVLDVLNRKADHRIRIYSELNTKGLSERDPEQRARYMLARTEMEMLFHQRSARGELHWIATMFPTVGYAMNAEMSLEDYEDFVYHAMRVDEADPIGAWKAVAAKQERIIEWLAAKKTLRVLAPGTELTVQVEGRKWMNCMGDLNLPDGEIFTGPHEDGLSGMVTFGFPSIYKEVEVNDIRLWFDGGRVVKASAGKNEAFLLKMLDTDEGARRVGEFAIATNYQIQRFSRNILLDEKIGGTMHLALGFGYPESGSRNVSAIHWDMVCDLRRGSEIYADDELFYKDGRFLNFPL